MRTGFVDDLHQNREPLRQTDRAIPGDATASVSSDAGDVTLGMTALLGIFFAVVLVCAVFFGFGYSTGRTLHRPAAPADSQSSATGGDNAGAGDKLDSNGIGNSSGNASNSAAPALAAGSATLSKPSPAALMTEAAKATEAPLAGASRYEHPSSRPRAGALTISSASLNLGGSRAERAHPEPAPAAPVSTVGATAIMVQIAAVARPGDADALARALRTNGYSAVVRTEPQDTLLHVQVGPFATREAARAMRARLQANGYNAFLKP